MHRIEWTWIDPAGGETLLRTETDALFIPNEPMSLYFNFWSPEETWGDAYDPDLQPAQDPGQNEIYTYEIDYVEVRITTVPGDSDNDNDVDITDYRNLAAQFGAPPPAGPVNADFNGDNVVDLVDIAILRGNFGFGVESSEAGELGSETHSAPEPATLILLGAAVPVVLKRKRKSGYT